MPKLWALSDLHVSYKANLEALSSFTAHPEDGLILAGDIGEKPEHLHAVFSHLKPLFKQLWWVPGNHELYTMPRAEEVDGPALRGELKYRECAAICREHNVLTPEDDFVVWEDVLICPLFTLYDYSFRPSHVSREGALDWAREEGIEATDEALLHNDPWTSRDEWCEHLVHLTHAKLAAARAERPDTPFILINHWPLKERLVQLFSVPRFCIWCGTTLTEDWHKEFAPVKVVISGHLHIRRTDWIDGTRFEEVSVGYPRQWKHAQEQGITMEDLMREILPGPPTPEGGNMRTFWRRFG